MKLEVDLERTLGKFKFATEFSLEGDRVGVFGPSGSGKSTLMHLLAGLLKPDSGFIRLNNEVFFDAAKKINRAPEERRIGVVFQHAHLFPHLSVRGNLHYGYRRIPKHQRKIDPDTLIEVLGLEPLLRRATNSLSGGERQRVALGRTLLAFPKLVLMDEPLSGLDDGLKYQIIPYLQKVFAEFGIPLIFISHSLNEMRLMTDQVLELAPGGHSTQTSAADLALRQMGTSRIGYINLLKLRDPRPQSGLCRYRWGNQEIFLPDGGEQNEVMVELSSKDITLFKRHPEAASARNILSCRVKNIYPAGNRVGVELDCKGEMLVAQVVGESVRDLGLKVGGEIFAVFKAVAFRRLY